MARSDRSSDSIEKLLEERSQYEQWIARLNETGAPDSVRSRVRSDYESRLDNVMGQLRAHESTIAEALGRHQADRERLEAKESGLLETLAEAEVRHSVGEYDDRQWNEISGTQKKSLNELKEELGKVRSEIDRLSEVQRLIRAAPAEGVAPIVEPEPEPVVPAPADPVAYEPPPAAAATAQPAASEPAAPRFVPRPPGQAPGQRLAGDELDFLKSVAVEQSASLSPAAAEKRGTGGQSAITTTTPPPEVSPQPAAPPAASQASAAGRPAPGGPAGAVKTLKCGDCGTLNRPTEWYCERCGAELAAL
ncbi:MAG TPA: hypothetical protein VFT04_08790 [Gemmatimonadales bacterium]|nr:hypothetical protein [Gemmatimonadales bacterium]